VHHSHRRYPDTDEGDGRGRPRVRPGPRAGGMRDHEHAGAESGVRAVGAMQLALCSIAAGGPRRTHLVHVQQPGGATGDPPVSGRRRARWPAAARGGRGSTARRSVNRRACGNGRRGEYPATICDAAWSAMMRGRILLVGGDSGLVGVLREYLHVRSCSSSSDAPSVIQSRSSSSRVS
jgi:hypothetical protein